MSSPSETAAPHDRHYDAVVAELESAESLLLTTHENPDGDALGSLVAMYLLLKSLKRDVVMYLSPAEFPLPSEYSFLPLELIDTDPPSDLERRMLVFLDCGNLDRTPVEFLRDEARIINIDHHHDNTRFGTVNLVVGDASCTAELVFELSARMGVTPTAAMAEAIMVAMITDTGKFMYENTTAHTHRVAADLIDAGADVPAICTRLYEELPIERLHLMSRALASVERYDDGVLTVGRVLQEDFIATRADDSDTEGVVDQLRTVQGTIVAALIRDVPINDSGTKRKVSLRSKDDRVDVSAVARGAGGGGHRRAAGFTTEMPHSDLLRYLRDRVAEQLNHA